MSGAPPPRSLHRSSRRKQVSLGITSSSSFFDASIDISHSAPLTPTHSPSPPLTSPPKIARRVLDEKSAAYLEELSLPPPPPLTSNSTQASAFFPSDDRQYSMDELISFLQSSFKSKPIPTIEEYTFVDDDANAQIEPFESTCTTTSSAPIPTIKECNFTANSADAYLEYRNSNGCVEESVKRSFVGRAA